PNRDVFGDIHRVHDADYVRALKALAQNGGGYLDSDTVMSAESYDLALLAVTAWLEGVDWVSQHQSPAFALVRPPGHHAERAQGMGFCLLSNAAIAAHYTLNSAKANRVAILDWDVHHGNGTQALVENNSRIAYCSFHQSPAYPGTGAASEKGMYNNVLNLPMSPGSQLTDYQQRWEAEAAPFLKGFDADFIIVSAGYDATQADPLAGISLQPDDYGWFTQVCLALTPNVLFGLEGGYDYRALAESVAATIRSAVRFADTGES
ncbi:MAG: histone deacetylase, partial [Phormidesmis sp.]